MRVITWNRSFRGIPNVDDGKDDFDAEEHETHATVLDKLLAWEKKLYDEVKVYCSISFHFVFSHFVLKKRPYPVRFPVHFVLIITIFHYA